MVRIVRAVHLVLLEGDRVGDLIRLRHDRDGPVERARRVHDAAVEGGHGLRLERHGGDAPVARLDDQPVVDEVEADFERAPAVWDRRGRQAARRHVERGVPGMIDRRAVPQPDLADDLQPHVERRVRVAPGVERQARPVVGA
ncbi:MAG: hypothetical protein HY657_20270 [Acidobacteria bacterium]|nr:hypothetical protein [Acidobacteriota bacterium]